MHVFQDPPCVYNDGHRLHNYRKNYQNHVHKGCIFLTRNQDAVFKIIKVENKNGYRIVSALTSWPQCNQYWHNTQHTTHNTQHTTHNTQHTTTLTHLPTIDVL
jgi:L-rhamnose mutarotase